MMGAMFALMWNGFREARRNRVTVIVAAFTLVLLLSTSVVMEVTVFTFDRVNTDVGLGVMSLLLVFLAIFLSSAWVPREIERRTIFMVLSKPISRATYLVGRLAGNMLTLAILLVVMSLVFAAELMFLRSPVTQPIVAALVALFFELLILSSLGFFVSSFSGQIVSAVVVSGLFFAGHLAGDIYRLASRSKVEALQWLGKGVYYLLPNLDRLDLKVQAAYATPVPWGELGASAAYAIAYSTALMVATIAIFQRRDFR
jgi:ABC-type transport system involved in multi-copper enzyme maturation permease subunit